MPTACTQNGPDVRQTACAMACYMCAGTRIEGGALWFAHAPVTKSPASQGSARHTLEGGISKAPQGNERGAMGSKNPPAF